MATLISFYTTDWKYAEYANALIKDCERLKISHKIEKLPSTGSYLKNTCMKPAFILDKLLELKSPVLWVDCDGSVLGKPYFSEDFDFAAKKKVAGQSRTWHVGTMWFNYTENMIKFLEKWVQNTGRVSDESALEATWRELGNTIKTSDIPKEYFIILKNGQQPHGVICHRISNGESKRKEMPIAKNNVRQGVF